MKAGEHLVKMAESLSNLLTEAPYEPQSSLFHLGVHAAITVPGMPGEGAYLQHYSNIEHSLGFESAFDDSPMQDEGEISFYNLTDASIERMKPGLLASCTGGYGVGENSDQGVWLGGWIRGVETEWRGADKLTTVQVESRGSWLGSTQQPAPPEGRPLAEGGLYVDQSFAAGITAQVVLRWLCDAAGCPLGAFDPARDHLFSEGVHLQGELPRLVHEWAAVCGCSAYVREGVLYVRDLSQNWGQNCLILNESTGLVGTPVPWCEEQNLVRGQEEKRLLTGYRVQSLLNHRLFTGVGVQLEAKGVSGRFTVKGGRHSFTGVSGTTEVILLA